MSKNLWWVQKLDFRFKGAGHFKYRLERLSGITPDKISGFNQMRKWCQDTFGDSMERELLLTMNNWRDDLVEDRSFQNMVWCWHVDIKDSQYYVYLRSDAELALWKLRWS